VIKIFVDAHVFDGEFQGTLTYIKELYLKVLVFNPNARIYFGARNIENVKQYFKEFKNVEYITYSSKSSYKRIFIEIPEIIDRIQCTHAHFQYSIPLRKNVGCKYIVTIHDVLFNDFPKEFSLLYRLKRNAIFYLSAKRCDYLLTVSNYSKQKISKQYRIKEKEIIVTPNAVSEDFFLFNISKEKSKDFIANKYKIRKYMLYVSRIEPRKNQTLLLKAFVDEKLYEKGYNLVFIGANSLNSGLISKIDVLGKEVKSSVHWIENVDDYSLKQFLNAAELFIYPSKAEGFGIPPLEAGSLCTPVLCSNSTAMAEFNFFSPYLFNPDDYSEFVQQLTELIKNHGDIDLCRIQTIIRKQYSWETSAKTLLETIKEPT
jgi:glycosyltransferase involved in cell wall biosynthesis